MRVFKYIAFLLFSLSAFSQAKDSLPELDKTIKVTDPFYREDQIYFGVTHSLITNKPNNFSPNSISIGTNFGLLRDIPINKQRTFAVAPGIGMAMYNLRNNLVLVDMEKYEFEIDNNTASKNVQKLTYLEIPIEFRWRTSKVHSHKFWRVYTGVKYSYLLNSKTKYDGDLGSFNYNNKSLLEKSNLGVYVSAGFNTWNLYAYYGFKPLYTKNTQLSDSRLNMINVGLMFYIL